MSGAAYASDNTILWSWHIWGTDNEPKASINPGNEVNGAGKYFMDRNLGALSSTATKPTVADAYKYFGLLYQWGRKEPFTGAGPQYTTTLGSDVNSIPTAIFNKDGLWMQSDGETGNTKPQTNTKGGYTYSNTSASSTYTLLTNPAKHYYGNDADNVIINNPNTWTPYSTTVTKSIYDPCPYGYRIPKDGSWTNWTNSHTQTWTQYAIDGGVAMQSSWWPASGNRNFSFAVLYDIGYGGRYWSASRYSSYAYQAYYLNFNYSGYVNPSYSNFRSHSFSVRCIAE